MLAFDDVVRLRLAVTLMKELTENTYNLIILYLANHPEDAGLYYQANLLPNQPPEADVGHLQVNVTADEADADDEEEEAREVLLARVDAQGRRRRRKRGPRKRRQWWVRPWGSGDRRLLFGHFDNLMAELRVEDPYSYFNFLRMSAQMFEELLTRLTPRIQKQDTNWRKAHSPGLKLAITLRYMATGENYPCLSYGFRVSRHTIAVIIPEVCKAIQDELAEEVVTFPQNEDEWRQVAARFQQKWNMPHALGALVW